MNKMLELNYKIVKKLRTELESKNNIDTVNERDMLWINQLSMKGIITPIKYFK
jgi:hypothetical protein